jgi:drug/metabolite transporter (DMT)-like permease
MDLRGFSMNPKWYVLAGIFMSAAAQIFLKAAGSYKTSGAKWLCFAGLSLFSYGIAFLSYYMALKYFEISRISPIMMAGIVSIIALYGLAAGEPMNALKVIGILMAVLSIFLISNS